MTLPEVTRIYQNHTFDSMRWQKFVPRDDDIVISTSYKSGTTWMQNIVANLVFTALTCEIAIMQENFVTSAQNKFQNYDGKRRPSC